MYVCFPLFLQAIYHKHFLHIHHGDCSPETGDFNELHERLSPVDPSSEVGFTSGPPRRRVTVSASSGCWATILCNASVRTATIACGSGVIIRTRKQCFEQRSSG